MGIICPRCGNVNRDGARFCASCGLSLSSDPSDSHVNRMSDSSMRGGRNQNPYGKKPGIDDELPPPPYNPGSHGSGYGDYSSGGMFPEEPDRKGDTGRVVLLALAAVIAVAIIGLSAVLIRSRMKKNTKADEGSTVEQSTDSGSGQEGTTINDTDGDTDSDIDTSTDVDTDTDNSDDIDDQDDDLTAEQDQLPYCDNDGMYFTSHNEVGDFNKMTSADGSYTFVYPKYMFNRCEYEPDGSYYHFYYENAYNEEEFSLTYKKYAAPGDPKENALAAQSDYFYMFSKTTYKTTYERHKKGGHQYIAIASGYPKGTSNWGMYALAQNDGSDTYCMEFQYEEYEKGTKKDYLQYIINEVYRECSFAWSKQSPMSFKDMKKQGIFE